MELSSLLTTLNTGQVIKSVELMRAWLADAAPGEPEKLLAECDKAVRPKISLLMRDLLSRFPSTVLGAPVLLYCSDEIPDLDECRPSRTQSACSIQLPYPPRENNQPCADLHFIGWLPLATQLPVRFPFRPEHHDARLPLNKIQAVVALFRSRPEVFDLDQLELPNTWWGELFRPINGNVHLSARMLLPYPDALEAARVLHAAARGEPLPTNNGFLSDSGYAWACDAGVLFQETCRHYFPTHSF